jgi:hypothetical protein
MPTFTVGPPARPSEKNSATRLDWRRGAQEILAPSQISLEGLLRAGQGFPIGLTSLVFSHREAAGDSAWRQIAGGRSGAPDPQA